MVTTLKSRTRAAILDPSLGTRSIGFAGTSARDQVGTTSQIPLDLTLSLFLPSYRTRPLLYETAIPRKLSCARTTLEKRGHAREKASLWAPFPPSTTPSQTQSKLSADLPTTGSCLMRPFVAKSPFQAPKSLSPRSSTTSKNIV